MDSINKKIVMDSFCHSVFEKRMDGTCPLIDYDMEKFTSKINELYIDNVFTLKDGFAPYCKHIFITNFTSATSGTLEITESNRHLLRSKYEARNENELAVLTRWFPKELLGASLKNNIAKYLDIILYSYDQVQEENNAMGTVDSNKDFFYDYAIISIKPQNLDNEIPMQPITYMKSALGKEYGGLSIPIDLVKYNESVLYWEKNALIK